MRGERFTSFLKKQVWIEQKGRCAICGEKCRGHGAKRRGQVHHINPVAFGGPATRRNAIGVCEADHKILDQLAFEKGILYGDLPPKNNA